MTTNSPPSSDSPPPGSDLRAKVEEWLNSQGYPLEYRTYWALYRHFLGKTTLGAYVRPEAGDAREVDVSAYETHIIHGTTKGLHLRLLCECKYSKDKPWVLLYGNMESSSYFADWAHTPRSKAIETPPNLSQEQITHLTKAYHFSEGLWDAHSIVQAFGERGGRDPAYDSLRKITHAAWDYLEGFGDTMKGWVEMAFPCLVVDGPLLAAGFDPKAGRIWAKEIKYGRLCWQGCRNGTKVDIVHASALDEYADKVSDSFMTIMQLLVELHGG